MTCVCVCVLSRPSWAYVKLQTVVSSVKPGRQERRRRKRSVISAHSKLSWWMNSRNVSTYKRTKTTFVICFHWIMNYPDTLCSYTSPLLGHNDDTMTHTKHLIIVHLCLYMCFQRRTCLIHAISVMRRTTVHTTTLLKMLKIRQLESWRFKCSRRKVSYRLDMYNITYITVLSWQQLIYHLFKKVPVVILHMCYMW